VQVRTGLALVAALMVLVSAGSSQALPRNPGERAQRLRVEVLDERAHDPGSFTEGLELAGDVLYESTGLVGSSSLRAVDPMTGHVLRRADLAPPLFGEGITVVGDRIWQLTWQQGIAIEWDRSTLTEVRRVTYSGEGWGLCYDGARLVASDGSNRLTFRDPHTFQQTGQVRVSKDGSAVQALNELECVAGAVWANVWPTNDIVRIDPSTGRVTAVVDASGLTPSGPHDVLNGIAAVPGSDEFLLGGKLWPSLFRVRFVPSP
jgi:glutamine cyclotransferase